MIKVTNLMNQTIVCSLAVSPESFQLISGDSKDIKNEDMTPYLESLKERNLIKAEEIIGGSKKTATTKKVTQEVTTEKEDK